MKISLDKIALGITDDEVPLGSHTSGILTANSSAEFAFSSWGSMTNLSTPFYSDTTKRMSESCRLCERQAATSI
ncbi:MAG: hypothetical protein WBW54_07450, partial [Candidatus Acidiferrales bacterium]